MTFPRAAAFSAAALLAASPCAHAAAGPTWLTARAALKGCLGEADAGRRAQCLESAARALDAAEASGEGPIPTPQQARREAEKAYGLHEGAREVQARAKSPRAPDAVRAPARLSTIIAQATLDASGDWVMTTREGAVWAQTDQTSLSRPPGPGSTLVVRPAALGSFFCLISDRREVRCKRRS